MRSTLTIKARLLMAMTMLSLLLTGIGVLGLYNLAQTNESLRTIHDDRVVPLAQLSTVSRNVLLNRSDLTIALNAGSKDLPRVLKLIDERRHVADQTWADYMLTYLTPEEERAAKAFAEARQRWLADGLEPALRALKAGQQDAARKIVAEQFEPLFAPMWPLMDSLIEIQIKVSRSEYAQAQNTFQHFRVVSLSSIFFGLLVAVFLSLWLVGGIRRQLAIALGLAQALQTGTANKLEAVNAIAAGDLDRDLADTALPAFDAASISQDEVGQLVNTVIDMSKAQQRLDSAFLTMTAALRSSREAEAARDWLKSAQNDLNTVMRGEHAPLDLADSVLTYLAERLEARIGTCYLLEEGSPLTTRPTAPVEPCLLLSAGYALPGGAMVPERLGMHEGLIGEAVRAGNIQVLAALPENYLPIRSSLGETEPVAVLILPLLHGGKLVGVIELGALTAFSAQSLVFLESVSEAIAIALSVSRSRQRLQQLMEQLQQQTEELRVQQEELQQSNEELEERAEMLERQREQIKIQNGEIQAASQALRQKAEELERTNTYKSEFLSTMSHELRTPLNSMLVLSGLLSDNKGGNLNPKQVEFASTIHNAGQDLLELINDILDLSKVEAGHLDFHYEDIAPAELLQSMALLFHNSAERKGLQLVIETDADLPATLRLDIRRTQQILKNLLGNALKFTEHGVVGLSAAVRAANANPLGVPALEFAVSDTGIGVPATKMDLIFEAFQQADGGISRKYGGTGLGLAISRQLARSMGGELRVESEVGKGSTFFLYLPRAVAETVGAGSALSPSVPLPAKSAPVPSRQALSPSPDTQLPPSALADDRAVLQQGQRSILIVEDDIHFARVLMDFVRERDFAALVAVDGESGLQLARHFKPSAILLDVMLPGIDGWTVLSTLKAEAATQRIPVHFITCLEDRQKALDLGALGLLTKPVDGTQIAAVIEKMTQSLVDERKHLLIVESNPDEAAHLSALLAVDGVQVRHAATGRDALAALETGGFDCVVLDLELSDMLGQEVLAVMQASYPALPVVIYTSQAPNRKQERSLQSHPGSVVMKGSKGAERLLGEVTLFLHMVDSTQPAGEMNIPASAKGGLEGKTVLLVDDDMRNLFSLSSLLATEGMRVVEAENGKESLLQLQAHPEISVVLMDIMMPEMDGYETMRHIRANPHYRSLPIIAMTAKAMPGDQQKCIDAGASDYISKPVDAQKLFSLLRVWLSHS